MTLTAFNPIHGLVGLAVIAAAAAAVGIGWLIMWVVERLVDQDRPAAAFAFGFVIVCLAAFLLGGLVP